MELKKILVPVTFTGNVEISVPANLSDERQRKLSQIMALTFVLATTDNYDAPEEDACDQFIEESGLDEAEGEGNWDDAEVGDVSGTWTLTEGPVKPC